MHDLRGVVVEVHVAGCWFVIGQELDATGQARVVAMPTGVHTDQQSDGGRARLLATYQVAVVSAIATLYAVKEFFAQRDGWRGDIQPLLTLKLTSTH